MTTTTICIIILTCMILATLLGLNLFLLPFYAITGRVMTLKQAVTRCNAGQGNLIFLRGSGILDRVWWTVGVPEESFQLRMRGRIVLSVQSESRLRQVVPELKTLRTRMFGMVDPMKLEDKS